MRQTLPETAAMGYIAPTLAGPPFHPVQMLVASLAACALAISPALSPQGPTTQSQAQSQSQAQAQSQPATGYPVDVEMVTCHPFRDQQGQPLDTVLVAAGSADLDGDRNQDLWFLAAAGPHQGRFSLQMARTTSLGRFCDWHVSAAGNFVDAATYRSTARSQDSLIVVDPTNDQPILMTWSRKSITADPREGFLGGGGIGWPLGVGSYEIDTRDDMADGHDDITVLQRLPNGHTRVKKLCLNTKLYNFLWPEKSVQADVPAELECLRMLDFDGDNRSDFVALVKGLGVLVGRDNAHGAFEAVAFWPIPAGVRDLCVGDVEGDGRDDFALCFDDGILVMLATPGGFVLRAMFNPPLVSPLAGARFVNVEGTGIAHLLGFCKDGRNCVFHDNKTILQNSSSPLLYPAHSYWSSQTFAGLRPGVQDHSVIVTDVDNDGDPDVVLRTPDRTSFMTLRNPSVSLGPTSISASDIGPLPVTELAAKGIVQDLVVNVPPLLQAQGFVSVEAAFFVVDPDSKNLQDPDYLYWGGLITSVDPTHHKVTLRTYLWTEENSFDAQVREYKKQREQKLPTAQLVYPQEFATIRFDPRGFVSVHGYNNGQRAESSQIIQDPSPTKSTLGARWVLTVNPPKPKADRDLMPWD